MKYIILIFMILTISLLAWAPVHAQMGMMGGSTLSGTDWDKVVEHTLTEEQEGKEVWQKLQSDQLQCPDLSDDDFGVLGEYFMGQMMGDSHTSMNAMMMQTHGEEGEEQIHIVMGKRLSGCDTSANLSMEGFGWMPMMNMMWGGWSFDSAQDGSSPFGNNSTNNMMNFGFGPFGGFGWIFMILWWVLIIAGIVALIKWLTSQSRGTNNHAKSALEILQERYAKGEINKQEFEEKKKDLS
jgi:uncharacterized membrane protein